MGKVKILVVEDELIIADNICNILEDLGYEPLEPAISYTEALETLAEEEADLALLDIQLAGRRDGIDLAWKIKDTYNIPFIFLTSNADAATVERSKKLNPPAYLLKPFTKDDLYTSIEIALYNYSTSTTPTGIAIPPDATPQDKEATVLLKNALFVKHKQSFQKLLFSDILFVKSEHVYVRIVTKAHKEYLVRSSLSTFLERLPKSFFKIQRSHLINVEAIDSIHLLHVKIDHYELPFGQGYRAALLKRLQVE